jgi:hypothetical protein
MGRKIGLKKKSWHTRENLEIWFNGLTPEQRLSIALEIEGFRKEARFVDD